MGSASTVLVFKKWNKSSNKMYENDTTMESMRERSGSKRKSK